MSKKICFGMGILVFIIACGASGIGSIDTKPNPCGRSLFAQAGLSDGGGRQDQAPAPRFSALAAGWGHTCAVTDVGSVYCWGNNEYAQLGNRFAEKSGTSSPD